MPNEQNLIPFNKRTESEQREYSKKGGQKSGEVRREKKRMRDMMNLLLSLELQDGSEAKEQLKSLGIDDEDLNIQTQILMAQVLKAMKGNLDSAKFIKEVSSEEYELKKKSESVDKQDNQDRIIIVDDLEDPDDEDS